VLLPWPHKEKTMGASDFANLPYIGESLKRKEDYRFLTGAGNYTDDIVLANQAYAVFVRSPHAHAVIKAVDSAMARSMPGVVGIFTGKDIEGKMAGLPCGWLINNPDGTPMKEPMHPILAINKARYVGDQVAMVVAETLDQARNAAEAVLVDYDVLPAVVSVADAAKKQGKVTIHDEATDNQCYKWTLGDKAAVDATFAKAAHVTKLDLVNNRLIPNAIEPRVAIGSYSRGNEEYTLHVSNQNPHVERLLMTAFVLGLPEHKVRVIAPDVGGGFGSKIFLYGEDVCLTWAAKQLNRSIKWTCERSESFLTDAHGRDHVSHAEMALTRTASSWRCGCTPTPTSAPTSRRSPLRSPPSCTRRCWPASTRRRRSTSRSMRGSPTPRRLTPTAALAGPKRPIWWSGW
jgi:carbon-monoxide dehydrogenase large subunit